MFDRILNYFREIKINNDFKRYEEECRLSHERIAEKRFSTSELQKEVSDLKNKIQIEKDQIYRDEITEVLVNISQIQSNIYITDEILRLFMRNYRDELDLLHKEKADFFLEQEDSKNKIRELRANLSNAKKRKTDSYEKVKAYQREIDSWHSKSDRTPWLGGNKGKKIPNHSFFGQSFGDLESFKYHRDASYKEVRNCKEEINNIMMMINNLNSKIEKRNGQINELFQKINNSKKDRISMYELKKSGHDKIKLQKNSNELHKSLKEEQKKLNNYEFKRNEFTTARKYQYGVINLENLIKNINENKCQFISEFFIKENQEKRKIIHRIEWLNRKS